MVMCALSSGITFSSASIGLMTSVGALIGLMVGRKSGWNGQVLAVFGVSMIFFVLTLILAPYISTIFDCSAKLV
jgi:hypothetical protein